MTAVDLLGLGLNFGADMAGGVPLERCQLIGDFGADLTFNRLDVLGLLTGAPITSTVPPNMTANPGNGSTLLNADQIAIDVTDALGLSLVSIVAILANRTETIWDGGTFRAPYSGLRTTIANGKRFTFTRSPGWPEATLIVDTRAADPAGNTTEVSFGYTVSNPSGLIVPTITNISPAPGTSLAATQSVVFDATDNTGLLFAEIQVDQIRREIVHDGDVFLDPYTFSSRVVITGGWRYTVTRTGGWVTAPTFRARLIDVSGNIP